MSRKVATIAAIALFLFLAVLFTNRGLTVATTTPLIPPRAAPPAPLEAESTYRAAVDADDFGSESERAVAHYNLGTALLLQRRYEEAEPHLRMAVDAAGDHGAAAAYNLGNTDLEPAFADSVLPGREIRLRSAIEAYKRALLLDSADLDAKWNLELARRLLERQPPPQESGGGDGAGGGGDGPPEQGEQQPAPTPAEGSGSQPDVAEAEAEQLLRAAQEREIQLQRENLRRPQPPGPIRP